MQQLAGVAGNPTGRKCTRNCVEKDGIVSPPQFVHECDIALCDVSYLWHQGTSALIVCEGDTSHSFRGYSLIKCGK
jgi:hypothetical protein